MIELNKGLVWLFCPNGHWNRVTADVYATLLDAGYGPDMLRVTAE